MSEGIVSEGSQSIDEIHRDHKDDKEEAPAYQERDKDISLIDLHVIL